MDRASIAAPNTVALVKIVFDLKGALMINENKSRTPAARPNSTLFTPSLNLDAVKRLAVFHLDDYITSPIAVRPQWIKKSDLVRHFESTEPKDFLAAYDALRGSKPIIDPNNFVDMRWGIQFADDAQDPLLAIYMDAAGVYGEINKVRVYFTNGSFLKWLRERFPV